MRPLLFILIVVATDGCIPHFARFADHDYKIGIPKKVTVGSVMISSERGIRDENEIFMAEGNRRELIYGGVVSGSTIRIIYREYYMERGSTFLKPGFSQDFTYDLTTGSTISYQDVRIQVLEASIEFVQFKVLAGEDF